MSKKIDNIPVKKLVLILKRLFFYFKIDPTIALEQWKVDENKRENILTMWMDSPDFTPKSRQPINASGTTNCGYELATKDQREWFAHNNQLFKLNLQSKCAKPIN